MKEYSNALQREKETDVHINNIKALLANLLSELSSLRLLGVGGIDESQLGGSINLQFEDLRLQANSQQVSGHIQVPDHIRGCPCAAESGRPYCIERQQEWLLRIGNTQMDNIYQFYISHEVYETPSQDIHP